MERKRDKKDFWKRKPKAKISYEKKVKLAKELRKQKRKDKKKRKLDHYNRRKYGYGWNAPAAAAAAPPEPQPREWFSDDEEPYREAEKKPPKKKKLNKKQKDAIKMKVIEEEKNAIKAALRQREIAAENKEIKKLEKELRLNKRKSKSIPKSFVDDGLDYLLEFCDEEKRAKFVAEENSKNLHESESEFEEDLEMVIGKKQAKRGKGSENEDSDSMSDGSDAEDLCSDFSDEPTTKTSKKRKLVDDDEDEEKITQTKSKKGKTVRFDDEMPSSSKSKSAVEDENAQLRKALEDEIIKKIKEQRALKANQVTSNKSTTEDTGNAKTKSTDKNATEEEIFSQLKQQKEQKAKSKKSQIEEEEKRQLYILGEKDGGYEEEKEDEGGKSSHWEDIYGRTRDKAGNVVPTKYVPPQLRNAPTSGKSLLRLQKQMKGLLNRLAQSNVKSIADEIEALYGANSRHDTSQTLTLLLIEALVGPVLKPDRLVAEHVLLIAILHANVGSDVGAHLVQAVTKQFDELLKSNPPVEEKAIDNVVLLLAHLYNFKVFSSILVFDILNLLLETFGPKEIELIIILFKTIGAKLRKDNPLALKDLIGRMQIKAGSIQDVANGSRVRYTMDVLLAIKNNNMSKIPNYDTTHADGLKKLVRSLLRQGNYVSELSISLEDLLKADERGRWWVVGSAWSGAEPKSATVAPSQDKETFSAQLLELAREQRMNTDSRRTIFCIIMAAEDYIDAFEKLINLKLRTQKEREIVAIIVDCCLQEKTFNPYYVHLATKFCVCDRKYQMAFQYLVWDKLKDLSSMGQLQMNNLAKFLSGMFLETQGLPLSVLKVINFAGIDKPTVRLVRRTLLNMVLAEPVETVVAAFTRIANAEKLRLFREGLRLFLHHFMLRNTASMPQDEIDHLKGRIELADKALASSESATLF